MTLEWKHSTDGIDWEELSALVSSSPVGRQEGRRISQNGLLEQHVQVLRVRELSSSSQRGGHWLMAQTARTSATSRSCQATKAPGLGKQIVEPPRGAVARAQEDHPVRCAGARSRSTGSSASCA